MVLVSEIFEEVLEVDGGEVGVDEGEDDPVRVAQLLHHLLHLQAQVAFASCYQDWSQYKYKPLQSMGVEIDYNALRQDNDNVLTCPPSFSDEHSECWN